MSDKPLTIKETLMEQLSIAEFGRAHTRLPLERRPFTRALNCASHWRLMHVDALAELMGKTRDETIAMVLEETKDLEYSIKKTA
ncbi:MAG: hypothetical protein ACRBFS_24295 [Aureispira sp.]